MKKQVLIASILALAGCGNIYSPLSNSAPGTSSVRSPGYIDDFDNMTFFNNLGLYNRFWTDAIVDPSGALPSSSTINTDTTVAGSTLPNGTPGAAIRLYGVMKKNINFAIGSYPYCLMEMDLGLPNGINIAAIAPTRVLVLHYKAGPTSIGKTHRVAITHYPITTYDWYLYTLTPPNGLWNEVRIKFGVDSGPQPAQPRFQEVGWSGQHVNWTYIEKHATSITIQPFSTPGADMPYDITIDDVRFE